MYSHSLVLTYEEAEKGDRDMPFWLQFVVQEALTVVSAFVQSTSHLTPDQKAAGQNLIVAGEAFVATFAAKKV